MNSVNGESTSAIVVWVMDAAPWAEAIHTHLAASGYQVAIAMQQDDALRLVNNHQAEALIVMSETEQAPSLTAPEAPAEGSPSAALRVLVTKAAPGDPKPENTFDLVVPPDSAILEAQLQVALKLHRENLQLRNENSRLAASLEHFKNAASEVEILKNAIVRNVSHELKTPLLQVKSAVSLLSEDLGETKLIQYATDATTRLEALVRNITLLGGSLDYSPGPVIVHDAVEHSVRNLRRIWQRKAEIDRIALELQKPLPPVYADKQGLSTVFQLLIDNALKFSQDKVEVIAETVDVATVRLSVRDYGIGIAAEQHESIFATFYQVDPSSTRRYGGTGVGLAIVKLILDHHNSRVTIVSAMKKGSTFSFELPVFTL